MVPFLLAAESFNDAQQAGRALGAFLWSAVAIFGIVQCARIRRRETTNSMGALALMLTFCALLFSVLGQAAERFLELPSWTSYLRAGVVGLLLLASIALGIIGLTQISLLRDRFTQGKAQAIWAISLSSVLIALGAGLTAYNLTNSFQRMAALAEGQGSQSTDGARAKQSEAVPEVAASGTYQVNEDFNYRFAIPSRPWSEMDPGSLNPIAKTAFFRPQPQSFIMVIPEEFGVETLVTADAIINVVKANLNSVARDVKFTEAIDETVNGIPGKRISATCNIAMSELAYSYWIATYKGFGYQVVTALQDGTREQAAELGREVTSYFQINDLDYVAHDAGAATVEPYRQPHLDYALDLRDEGWLVWNDAAANAPESDFAATFENTLFHFVATVSHEGLDPSFPDLKAAFLDNSFNLTNNDITLLQESLVETPAGQAFETRFTYSSDSLSHLVVARFHKRRGHTLINSVYLDHDYASEAYLAKVEAALDTLALGEGEPALDAYRSSLDEGQAAYERNFLNDIGILYYQSDNYQRARDYFAQAFARGESDAVILGNLILSLDLLGQRSAAIDAFEAHPETAATVQGTVAKAADVYYQIGQTKKAAELYQSVFSDGYADEDHLLDYLNALIDLDQRPQAIEIARAYAERTESWQARRWVASMLGDHGDYQQAAETLAALKAARPFDRQIDLDRAELDYKFEKYNAVIDAIGQLGPGAVSDSRLLALRGKAYYQLDSYVKAKRDFEAALELTPTDSDLQSWRDYSSNALGLGDQEVRKQAIPPVEIPDDLLAELLDTQSASKALNPTETHYHYSLLALEFEPEKIYKKTLRESIYIGDPAALEQFKTLSLTYDPFSEAIYLNAVEVLDDAQAIVATVNLDDCYVTSETGSEMAVEDKTLHVPVPGLQIGHTVRLTYTRLRQGAPDKLPFEDVYFVRSKPVAIRAALLKAPADSYRAAASPELQSLKRGDTQIWLARESTPYLWEPYQDRFDHFVPRLELSGEKRPWSELAQEYLEEIEDRLVVDPSTEQLAAEITAEAETDRDKAYSIYKYIQKNFTYKAIEFGPRGRMPNAAPTIVANRYGDCKDLALLARQLLAAVDVPSHLALVHSRDLLNADLPSLDQFDHMILYLPQLDGGRFFDCTDQDSSPDLTTPLGLDEQVALVLDPHDARLVAIPGADGKNNRIATQRSVQIEGNHLLISERFSATGSVAAYFRSYLKSIEPNKRNDALQSYMAAIDANVQLESFEHHALDDPSETLQLNFNYRVRDRGERDTDGTLLLRLPAVWERDYFAADFVKDRKTPFKIYTPVELEGATTLELPPGYRATTDPQAWNREDANAFHDYRYTFALADSGAPALAHRLSLKPGAYPSQRYAEFAESAQQALNALSRTLRLSPSP